MSLENEKKRNIFEAASSCLKPQAVTMLFLGFSAGLPILLIFSTLSVWLREAGVSRSAVTFFSWAALGYSFKFIWAPLVDLLPLPLLTKKLGRRRSWLILAQFSVIGAIVWMGLLDPSASQQNLTLMAMAAVLLGFSSATQDIVIDAYRIECEEQSMQALLASMYIAGYRVGMLVAGAGSLYLASWLGTGMDLYQYHSWRITYFIMALVMGVGVITTIVIPEPEHTNKAPVEYSVKDYFRIVFMFLVSASIFASTFFYSGGIVQNVRMIIAESLPLSSNVLGFIVEVMRFMVSAGTAGLVASVIVKLQLVDSAMVDSTYVRPVLDFFARYGTKTALLLLLLVGCYRVSDIVLGVVSNVFYLDIGFSKSEIATITKTFGLLMTLLGGFLGGVLTVRFGVIKILFSGALLSAATNLMFMWLAVKGNDLTLLTTVIAVDNLSAGLATTAFVAFLSSLTNVSFTAVQYAIFSSVMSLFPKVVGGYSGTMVSSLGYEMFFLITACMGIPVLFLVWIVRGRVQ